MDAKKTAEAAPEADPGAAPAAPRKIEEGTIITVRGPSALHSFINGAAWATGWLAVVLLFEGGRWMIKKIIQKDSPVA